MTNNNGLSTMLNCHHLCLPCHPTHSTYLHLHHFQIILIQACIPSAHLILLFMLIIIILDTHLSVPPPYLSIVIFLNSYWFFSWISLVYFCWIPPFPVFCFVVVQLLLIFFYIILRCCNIASIQLKTNSKITGNEYPENKKNIKISFSERFTGF